MSISNSVRKLETDAYGAILKAMAVTGLTWEREEFLGRLRVELNVSSEEHLKMRDQGRNGRTPSLNCDKG